MQMKHIHTNLLIYSDIITVSLNLFLFFLSPVAAVYCQHLILVSLLRFRLIITVEVFQSFVLQDN